MAMRRTSWIDQRINDGAADALDFAGVRRFVFFVGWRICAMSVFSPSWLRRASTRETWRCQPCHDLLSLCVASPELIFRSLEAVLDRPPVAFDRHRAVSIDVAGHQVVKKARSLAFSYGIGAAAAWPLAARK